MKQRSTTRENGSGGGGIPRPNNTASSSSNTSSPSKLAVRTNSRLLVAATAGSRQEPLGRTLSGDQTAGSETSKGGGGIGGLQVLDAGYKPLGGGSGLAAYSRGGGGGQRALVSDKLYPR
jgi:hypothetical protein